MFLITFIYWVMAYSYVVLTPSILLSNDYISHDFYELVRKTDQYREE